MIAEAAHSAADCVNEVFLAVGLYRARQPADAAHPFGHARERFLWAFMAAIASFLIGGCLSIAIAIRDLEEHHPVAVGIAPWIVLAVAFVADGSSWLQGMRQARRQAKDYDLTVGRYLVRASDPVVRAVLVEDSAALIGLLIAAGGLLLSRITGSGVPDSVASLLIGVLLAVTAFLLARPFADFLVGRSIPAAAAREAACDRRKRSGDRGSPGAPGDLLGARGSGRPRQGPPVAEAADRRARPRDGRARSEDPRGAPVRRGRVHRRDGRSTRSELTQARYVCIAFHTKRSNSPDSVGGITSVARPSRRETAAPVRSSPWIRPSATS